METDADEQCGVSKLMRTFALCMRKRDHGICIVNALRVQIVTALNIGRERRQRERGSQLSH